MTLIAQLALVSDTPELGVSELTTVAAALQKQIARDVAPIWDLQGTVDGFMHLDDVPPGYWPIIVRDDIEKDFAGFHCDQEGQPMALVTSGPGWSVTASHEAIEMLVDPFGNRTVAGTNPLSVFKITSSCIGALTSELPPTTLRFVPARGTAITSGVPTASVFTAVGSRGENSL